MYKNKIKEKLNRIAANHIELNHRPTLIIKEKEDQSLLFRPQRKKLSLSKDLSNSSVHNHNQSTDTILHDQDSSNCKKQYMKVFSNSCSKQLQKVQSTTLRLNHNSSSLYLSKRVNSQQIHLPQKRLFFGNQTEHNSNNNKSSIPSSHTGSKEKIIPVLIQAINCNPKQSNYIIDHDNSKTHVQRTQSVFTIDTEIKKITNDLFQTPIRHFKTCYDEEQTTFRKEEPKTVTVKNNCIYEQESARLKKTSRFVGGDHIETSKGVQKVKIMPNTENLCKENIFLEHSNRFVSPKYQNQHRIEHSPTPILRASTEASLQLKHSNQPTTSYQLSKSKAMKHLPISREIERVQEQRKQIESRISKKLDQLSERASQIARMCKADDHQRQLQQHKRPKILVSSSSKNIKHAAIMEPHHNYPKQSPSPSLAEANSDFIPRKASRQVNSYLLNSAHGSLRHQILNRIYS